MKLSHTAAGFLALAVSSVTAFSPAATTAVASSRRSHVPSTTSTTLFESAEATESATKAAPSTVPMPLSYKEMVRQVASAMKDANAQGKNHQIIRVCLPRDASNANLGVYSEGLLDVDSQDIVLVPPGKFQPNQRDSWELFFVSVD
jgi:hypothetical protein